jgi:hypothetical protein
MKPRPMACLDVGPHLHADRGLSKGPSKNRMGKFHSAHLARHGTKEVSILRYALQRAYDRIMQHHRAYLTFMSDMKNWFADPGQLTSMASTFEV